MPSRNSDSSLAPAGDRADILLAEKTRNLYHNSGLAAAVNVSIAVILYSSLSVNRSDWLWLILSVSAVRCGLFVWDKWQVQNEQKLIFKYRIALAVIALQGAAWGLSSLILYSSLSDAERFYMVAVLVGITGGSVLTLSPAFAAFFVFVVLAICPLLVVLILEETDVFRHVGVMGLIYVAAIIAVSRRINFSAIEQIALIYKLRWTVESFFAWWKRHLKVYHLIARSPYGLLVQILAGLITYLLLAIYCHEEHGEKVSIQRVRELRTKIRNEAAEDSASLGAGPPDIIDLDFSAYATS